MKDKKGKIKSFEFLSKILDLPIDIIYYISKYTGRYIHNKIENPYYFLCQYRLKRDKHTQKYYIGISHYQKYFW